MRTLTVSGVEDVLFISIIDLIRRCKQIPYTLEWVGNFGISGSNIFGFVGFIKSLNQIVVTCLMCSVSKYNLLLSLIRFHFEALITSKVG